jgi:hypothetical protein
MVKVNRPWEENARTFWGRARYSLSFAIFTANFASPRSTLRKITGSLRRRYGVRTLGSVAEPREPEKPILSFPSCYVSSQVFFITPFPRILDSSVPSADPVPEVWDSGGVLLAGS